MQVISDGVIIQKIVNSDEQPVITVLRGILANDYINFNFMVGTLISGLCSVEADRPTNIYLSYNSHIDFKTIDRIKQTVYYFMELENGSFEQQQTICSEVNEVCIDGGSAAPWFDEGFNFDGGFSCNI